jgi:hypothetical protein
MAQSPTNNGRRKSIGQQLLSGILSPIRRASLKSQFSPKKQREAVVIETLQQFDPVQHLRKGFGSEVTPGKSSAYEKQSSEAFKGSSFRHYLAIQGKDEVVAGIAKRFSMSDKKVVPEQTASPAHERASPIQKLKMSVQSVRIQNVLGHRPTAKHEYWADAAPDEKPPCGKTKMF